MCVCVCVREYVSVCVYVSVRVCVRGAQEESSAWFLLLLGAAGGGGALLDLLFLLQRDSLGFICSEVGGHIHSVTAAL